MLASRPKVGGDFLARKIIFGIGRLRQAVVGNVPTDSDNDGWREIERVAEEMHGAANCLLAGKHFASERVADHNGWGFACNLFWPETAALEHRDAERGKILGTDSSQRDDAAGTTLGSG